MITLQKLTQRTILARKARDFTHFQRYRAFSSESGYEYDLFVLGAGSGGVRCSRMSAAKGAKVAVAEPQSVHGPPGYTALGGTCVNVGCVPKKLFVYGSHYLQDFEDAQGCGWGVPLDQITKDWNTLVENKNKEISRLNGIYTRMLDNAGVDVIQVQCLCVGYAARTVEHMLELGFGSR